MMRQLIICLMAFSFFSCRWPVPHMLKQEFNCYTGQYTGLDTLINTHGFYETMTIRDYTGMNISGMKDGKYQKLGIDTLYSQIVFFNDGLYVGGVGIGGETVFEHINKAGIEDGRVWGRVAGTYMITGDTIKVKCIYLDSANNDWAGDEFWYKIIDKNTISGFYSRNLPVRRSDMSGMRKEVFKPTMHPNSSPSKFVYVPNIPKSYNWLKDEEWFNCE